METSDTITAKPTSGRSTLGAIVELSKPRLSLMSVITALLGYFAANPSHGISVFIYLTIGTSLAAAGAATINQWQERDLDAKMNRTKSRPLPSNEIQMSTALILGTIMSILGIALLYWGTNIQTAALGLATIVTYNLIYTPLKMVTRWNTEIGAIPGAIPPLMGWMAAEGSISTLGWILFAILFTWQMPHFMAISWMYKDDYAQGGFKMLVLEENGATKIARSAIAYTILLIIATLAPLYFENMTGWLYTIGAILLSLFIGLRSIQFFVAKNKDATARKLFFASIIHLPLLFIVLVVDRWVF